MSLEKERMTRAARFRRLRFPSFGPSSSSSFPRPHSSIFGASRGAATVVTSTLPTSPVVRPFFIINILVSCTEPVLNDDPVSHPSEKGSEWNNVMQMMQSLLLEAHVAYLRV
jgi:hypothetical protein